MPQLHLAGEIINPIRAVIGGRDGFLEGPEVMSTRFRIQFDDFKEGRGFIICGRIDFLKEIR